MLKYIYLILLIFSTICVEDTIMSKLKTFVKTIPGFRSNTKLNMIIAGIYYVVSLLIGFLNVQLMISFLTMPYIVFLMIDCVDS